MPEGKRRKMKLSVIELLRENGMPAPGTESQEEEDLFAAEDEEETGDEESGKEEKVVPPVPETGPNLKPKKKKKPLDYLA